MWAACAKTAGPGGERESSADRWQLRSASPASALALPGPCSGPDSSFPCLLALVQADAKAAAGPLALGPESSGGDMRVALRRKRGAERPVAIVGFCENIFRQASKQASKRMHASMHACKQSKLAKRSGASQALPCTTSSMPYCMASLLACPAPLLPSPARIALTSPSSHPLIALTPQHPPD